MMKVNDNEILWTKIKSDAKIPTKLKENAGYDIYACFNEDFIKIPLGQTKLIPTGLACAFSHNYYIQLEERGSTGSKGIKISAGVIDSGYRGEIFVALTNCSGKNILISKLNKHELVNVKTEDTIIYPYDKAICQGIVHIVPNLESKETNYNELLKYNSERGYGSLGSSGK